MPLNNPESWMEQAFALATAAARTHGEVPVGALLVRDSKVIATGTNERLRSERTTAHAEIMALEKYNAQSGHWRCEPGTILVVTTEPCLMCTGALLWARVDEIYYGCDDPRGAGLRRVQPLIVDGVYDHRFSLVQGGVLGGRCGDLMTGFFAQMRTKKTTPDTEL